MGYRENVWVQAQSLFDEVKQMDSSTASAFYNALTDMLWHFGQVSFTSSGLQWVNYFMAAQVVEFTLVPTKSRSF